MVRPELLQSEKPRPALAQRVKSDTRRTPLSWETGMNPKVPGRQPCERTDSPLELSPEEFRALGYRVVDRMAEFLKSLPERPVTRGESAQSIRKLIDIPFPEHGAPAEQLLEQAMDLLL